MEKKTKAPMPSINIVEEQLTLYGDVEKLPSKTIVNVSSVPQRSPFRYAGGKTWLIPEVRKWLTQADEPVATLLEPFVGGGIVSLTAVAEHLAENAVVVELDQEVYAVWATMLGADNAWLANRIYQFDLNATNVNNITTKQWDTLREIAFATIIKNRTFHGGILAKGAGLLKNGENGKGLASRWYPKTLRDRIEAIAPLKNKIVACHGNAFDFLKQYSDDSDCYHFIDPPYFQAGKRLYTHFDIDHDKLFRLVAGLKGKYLLTYDNNPQINALVKKYNLQSRTIPMKTTHHLQKEELLISDNFDWL
ncbi:MAG: DNA adenine methylase [Chitinophagaceae bacterium]